MSNPDITVIDGLTDMAVVREMTDNEAKSFSDRRKEAIAETRAQTERIKARQAVLDRLGITADEAALLLG